MFRFKYKAMLLFAAALFCANGVAQSQQTRPIGTWLGVMSSTNTPVEASSTDGKLLSVHFGEPDACKVDAKFAVTKADGSYYAISPSQNGGSFCKKLYPGQWLTAHSGGRIVLSLLQGGATKWSVTLSPES